MVIACNTASAAALRGLREQWPGVPFVGMEPAVKPAAHLTAMGKVGVLATQATFQGELFADLVARYGNGVEVLTAACPAWRPSSRRCRPTTPAPPTSSPRSPGRWWPPAPTCSCSAAPTTRSCRRPWRSGWGPAW